MAGHGTAASGGAGRRAVHYAVAAVLVCLLTIALAAQESAGGSSLSASAEQGAWTVGDRIGFTLVLVHPPGLEPSLPEVQSELGPFLVRDFADDGSRILDDGRVEQTWRYRLTAYETGELEIPSVAVALTGGPAGLETVRSAPVTVPLHSVIEGEVEDIADLRPPGEVPYSFVPLVLWCLAGLIALAGLLWLRVWWIRRRRRNALRDEASMLPPRELAIRELRRLTASDLLKQDRYKMFYIAISGIIDRLLHGALGVITVERTSWEIMRDLREQAPGTPLVPAAGEFFAACDRVKFSRHVPGAAENSSVIACAYRLVDLAAPEPNGAAGSGGEVG
jgi:hypothetical protein